MLTRDLGWVTIFRDLEPMEILHIWGETLTILSLDYNTNHRQVALTLVPKQSLFNRTTVQVSQCYFGKNYRAKMNVM